MYAIIKTGGKQYKVAEGDEIFVEKIAGDSGATVDFNEVLAYSTETGLVMGEAAEAAKVTGEIVKQGKGKKLVIFKYKAKKGFRRKQGHRQPYTRVRITAIKA